jgi:hypothetical protein
MICFHFRSDCKDPILSKEIFWILLIWFISTYVFLWFFVIFSNRKKATSSGNGSTDETFSDDIGSLKQYPDTIIQVKVNGLFLTYKQVQVLTRKF